MPSLNWIGKEKIVNHDKEVPFRLLKKHKGLSLGTSENLIIEGDNLEALKALMPYYVGKVKCIYIDPPYNTGNEGWVYNDNVNSPKIKQWLNKEVKIDDLTRHDKWLCMMYPRLKLLRDLLSDDGVIFISIDDNEHCHLKMLLEEIFGNENFVGTFIWRKKEGGGQADANFVREHEYIMTFRKTETFKWKDEVVFEDEAKFNKIDSDGKYTLLKLAKWGNTARKEDRPSMHFSVIAPDGSEAFPFAPDGSDGRWRIGKARMQELVDAQLVEFQKKDGKWIAYEKIYFTKDKEKIIKARSILYDLANTADASKTLTEIFGTKDQFDTPKPVDLIKFFIKHGSNEDSIILDSFAGSGTTGQAVLELNKDGGNRKFIMVEMEKDIAQKITSERVRRVSKDLSGGFEYCTLGNKLFNADRAIDEDVVFDDLANYIYFTETQTNLEKKQISGNFIGEHNENDFYLLFKEKGKNTLTKSFLKNVTKNEHKKIIYADFCTIPDELIQSYNITFKQIPYEVKVY